MLRLGPRRSSTSEHLQLGIADLARVLHFGILVPKRGSVQRIV
jgi:hypothetical protein